MIQRVYEQTVKGFKDICVATDDIRIFDEVKEFGGKDFDLRINVQGDEPLIDPLQLKELEKVFEDKKNCLATMAKKKVVIDQDSNALYFSRSTIPNIRDIEENEWVSNHKFLKHIGLYAYRPKTLYSICKMQVSILEGLENLEQLRWLENGLKIKVIETNYESYAVDTPLDLEKLITLLA